MSRPEILIWDRRFIDHSSYGVKVTSERVSFVSSTRAEVNCTFDETLVPKRGEPSQRSHRVNIELEKGDAGWRIVTLRSPTWR